jgi:hypothetical protein
VHVVWAKDPRPVHHHPGQTRPDLAAGREQKVGRTIVESGEAVQPGRAQAAEQRLRPGAQHGDP